MDSEYQRDGRLMDMIDEKWRADRLPKEDVEVDLLVEFLTITSASTIFFIAYFKNNKKGFA